MPVAVKTGESEVLKYRKPAMLASLYVIDMKGQRIDGSRQMAILTSVLRALPDLPDNVPSHE